MHPLLVSSADYILATSKRVLGVEVKSFAKNTAIVTTSYGVSVVRGLVTGYLVARLFPREIYGQYQFILSAVGTVAAMGIPGIVNSLSRAVARGEQGVILPVARLQFGISLIVSALLVGSTYFLPDQRQSLWPLFLLAALVFPLSQTASAIFSAATVGNARFDVSLKANIAWSVAMILATLAIIFLHPSAALLYLAATTFPALTYLHFSRPLIKRVKPEPNVRHIVRYGVQLTLLNLPVSLSWYVDKLMISAMLGLNQLAIFSVGILIPEQVKTLAKELLPVSFAVQARGDDTWQRRKRLIGAVGRGTLIFAIGITVYIFLAPWIFLLFFPNYPEAIILSQVAAAMLITQPSALLTQYIEAQAMLNALRWTQWISAAVFVISLVTLIPAYGLMGAVVARGLLRLSTAICAALYLIFFKPDRA